MDVTDCNCDPPSIMVTPVTPEPQDIMGKTGDETDAFKWTDIINAVPDKPTDAVMPVDREAFEYNMKHEHRGIAVIFNNKKFMDPGLSERTGTDKDRDNLKNCLEQLGFKVKVYEDALERTIRDVIYQLSAKEDHSKRDCLFIAVFSHGDNKKIHARDTDYNPEILWESFRADRCPTLAGKPKIFLIQACQGDQLDSGTLVRKTATDSVDSSKHNQQYVVPNQADFLITYSTFPGYYSWRSTADGTWFIQAFTKVLRTHSKEMDLLSMMTIVAREVALNFESNTPGNLNMHGKKQVPYITSTLIRDIFFR